MRRNRRTRNHAQKQKIKEKKAEKRSYLFPFAIVLVFAIILFFAINFLSEKFGHNIIDTSVAESEEQTPQNDNSKEEEKKPEDITFTISAIGDVMCHNTQYWDAYNKDTGKYDFSYVFNDISYYTKRADLLVANLETSFAGEERGYSNYPTFNSPDNLAYSLKDIGVDVLTTAGNHCLDMGFSGLSRTIDVLNDSDIAHLGTYKTQEDRDKVFIKYVKGVKIAFVDYTYGTNGIPVPSDKPYCVNLIDKDLIKKDIENAKTENPDMIIACMHWGTEYQTKANSEQEDLADFLFKNGVNVIIGNHPHVLQQMEKRTVTLEDGSTRDGFVIYALGNFICDQRAENTRNSIILDIKITKHIDGSITIDNASYTPIHMYKDNSLSIKKMRVLDIEKTLEAYESGYDTSIGSSNYTYLQEQLEKIKKIVGDEF